MQIDHCEIGPITRVRRAVSLQYIGVKYEGYRYPNF